MKSLNTQPSENDAFVICHCKGMKRSSIKKLIERKNIKKPEELMARLKIGTGCGCCMMAIRMFLTEVNCQQRSS